MRNLKIFCVIFLKKNGHLSSGITTSWAANQSDAKLLEGGVVCNGRVYNDINATYVIVSTHTHMYTQIAKFMGPTWGPHGSCRPQVGPTLAPWTLLSVLHLTEWQWECWGDGGGLYCRIYFFISNNIFGYCQLQKSIKNWYITGKSIQVATNNTIWWRICNSLDNDTKNALSYSRASIWTHAPWQLLL